MSEEEKRNLTELMDKGDLYGLMLASVRMWAKAYHPRAIRAAVYAVECDDAEPSRIRIPLSAATADPACPAPV